MCELAEYLESIGLEKGIIAMIRENLEENRTAKKIVEKLVKYFSLTEESAKEYYNMVVTS